MRDHASPHAKWVDAHDYIVIPGLVEYVDVNVVPRTYHHSGLLAVRTFISTSQVAPIGRCATIT